MADRKEYYKQYNATRKEQQKQYHAERYELNKEHILTQHKQYRLDHKDELNLQRREKAKIKCDLCGSPISCEHLARHKRTAKCKAVIL